MGKFTVITLRIVLALVLAGSLFVQAVTATGTLSMANTGVW